MTVDERPVLEVRDLVVEAGANPAMAVVRGVSFQVERGETVCIVGESGSGKSMTVMSMLGLVDDRSVRVTGGGVSLGGRDLLRMSAAEHRQVLGRDVGVVFQDPMTSLNPVATAGRQVAEAVRAHDETLSRRDARARAVELLELVGIPSPRTRADAYPHQLSGGMRQRVLIAMAMANRPGLLVADEPTTALDVTVQAQVLEALQDVQRHTGAAVVLITHDMGLVAELADRVLVMYAGTFVEEGTVREVFHRPRHPYTAGLLRSSPRRHAERHGELATIEGEPPEPRAVSTGCPFAPRCAHAAGRDECTTTRPGLAVVQGTQASACHFAGEMTEVFYQDPAGSVA